MKKIAGVPEDVWLCREERVCMRDRARRSHKAMDNWDQDWVVELARIRTRRGTRTYQQEVM